MVAARDDGTSFILAVGVDDFSDPLIPNLQWAAADATTFFSAATSGRDPGRLESRLLVNGDATLKSVRNALGDWLATSRPSDNVIVYFAGHGARELRPGADVNHADAYLLPVDAEINSLYSTSLSLRYEVPTLLQRIAARHVIFILDCCLAGSSRTTAPGMRNRGIDGPNITRAEAVAGHPLHSAVALSAGGSADVGEGVIVLSACGPNQSALESDEFGHGVFTHFLTSVMQHDREQGVQVSSVGSLYERTTKLVRGFTSYEQIPMLEGRVSDQGLYVGE
jgi:uncharacterized caspase-like protein